MPLAAFVPGPLELLIVAVMFALTVVVTVVPFWMICTKAGFPGWYSLAVLLPVLNVVLLFYLAFAEWPALSRRAHGDDRGPR